MLTQEQLDELLAKQDAAVNATGLPGAVGPDLPEEVGSAGPVDEQARSFARSASVRLPPGAAGGPPAVGGAMPPKPSPLRAFLGAPPEDVAPVDVAPPDFSGVDEAQSVGSSMRLAADLGRAANQGAWAGLKHKPDLSQWDQLRGDAEKPAQVAEGRRKMLSDYLTKKAQAGKDAEEKTRQAKNDYFTNAIKARQLESAPKGEDEEMRQARLDSLRANTDRAKRGPMPPKPENPAVAHLRALQTQKLEQELGAGGKIDQQTDKQVQDLAKLLEGLPTMRNNLETLQKYAKLPDIPGVGMGQKFVPDWASSNDGVTVRQAAAGVVNALLKKQSGSAVSEPEVERKMTELGMGRNATEEQFRQGLPRLIENIAAEYRTTEGGFPPKAVETARSRGVITSADLPASAGAGGAVMVSPNGQRFNVPADGVAEAEQRGWKRAQ